MKNALFILFIALSFVVSGSQAFAKGNSRYASIIIDADTGAVLEEQYADKALHPASLTKVMTLLMLFEAMEERGVRPHDRIRISAHAASMVPSKLGLKPGATISVEDAIGVLVTKSANDIAAAVAEFLGGSEQKFAQMMNRKAIEIGMTRTTFANASGLHDPRQISTARDMAKLARHVIKVYPRQYRYFSMTNFRYNGNNYHNHNRLMGQYKGMDGMKTGYVAASGFNLVASAVRNDRRIIAVVFGGRTSQTRNAHMEVLLDRGFGKMKDVRVASVNIPVPSRKPAVLGALAVLNKAGEEGSQKLASLNPAINNNFKELIGEGDYDPTASVRVQTGLSAIEAHQSLQDESSPALTQHDVQANPAVKQAAYQMPAHTRHSVTNGTKSEPWSVQIGAFNSRAATDRAIHNTLRSLPEPYASAQPMIAPLKAGDNWLFRARLSGFTKEEAYAACQHISECLPIAPRN